MNDVSVEFNSTFNDTEKVRLISHPNNQGKGAAVRSGVAEAKYPLIIFTDVDFPYTRDSFLKVLTALQNGADVAIGVRPASYYHSLPKSRVVISKTLRFIIRNLLRIPTDDTQCGLKGFNEKGRETFLNTTINRYLFDMEFITLAARKKLSIQLVEVHLKLGIQMAAMPVSVLLQEGRNFLKILFS